MTQQRPETRTTDASIADRAADALDAAREKAVDAYDAARERALEARDQARTSVGDNALVALGGGLALGAIVAALLPTTRRERALVGPYADKVKARASDAVGAAKDAGTARLGELGLTKTAGQDVIRQIIDGATDAIKASAKAAAGAAKGK